MMLKTSFGPTTTGNGLISAGVSHCLSDCPGDKPSSTTYFTAFGGSMHSSAPTTVSSRNKILASLSSVIDMTICGVAVGGIGATPTPARSAPRNTPQYSIDVLAQM